MPVVELDAVTRRFGDLTAVDGVSLQVDEGEIVGLLGHNGAGKTTLIRVLNGLLAADAGTVRVHGLDPMTDGLAVRRRTGVLTEYPALEAYLTVRENLEIYASINALGHHEATTRIDHLLAQLGLDDKDDEPAGDLSAGLKQRVALARALLHDPALLLLDEPTTNMDPVAARTVRALISEAAREQGRTVLLSTHNLPEAEELCDRVAIMRHGRLLLEGSPAALRRRLGSGREVTIRTAPGADRVRLFETLALASAPAGDPGHLDVEVAGDDAVVVRSTQSSAVAVDELVVRAVRAHVPVLAVEPSEPTLEDLYVMLHDHWWDEGPAPGSDPVRGPAREPARGRGHGGDELAAER